MGPQLHDGRGGSPWTELRIRPARSLLILCIFSIAMLSKRANGLQSVPGSPCESVCNNATAGTLLDDVVCLDDQFYTQPGSFLRECVTCELNSTAVDQDTKVTDVQWALFNLRYALSNCMFAYPVERVSISSPCQVTCAPLQKAIVSNISNSTDITSNLAELDFCKAGQFDDTTINQCSFCYSLIPEQVYLGNFLQALHIACHSPPSIGSTFYPDGRTIFNLTPIKGPTSAAPVAAPSAKLSGWKLMLAIVLPVMAGIVIAMAACFCCWHFTRKRRQNSPMSGRMSRFQDDQSIIFGDKSRTSTSTPKQPSAQHVWAQPATEMQNIVISPKVFETPNKKGSMFSQGHWFRKEESTGSVPQDTESINAVADEKMGWQSHGQPIGVATSSDPSGPDVYHSHGGYLPKS